MAISNQLARIMAHANAGKQLNAPTEGMQKVVNADGTVTEIPYQEDRFGRRTVMTREGPRVLPGHEGKDPYGDLGGSIGNVLGGLINKGRLGRQERIAEKSVAEQEMANPTFVGPAVPSNQAELEKARERMSFEMPKEKIDYFDISGVGQKKAALSRVEMGDGSILLQESSTDAQGNPTIRFIDPNSGTQIGQTITTGLGMPAASVQSSVQPPSGNAAPTVNTARNRFGATVKPLNATEQKIQDYLPEGVSVDGRAGTTIATPEQRLAARVAADKKPIKRADVNYSAALLLSDSESKRYMSGTLSDEDFRKLHNKAMTLLAKEPIKKTEGVMDKERAFSQMTLAMPTLAKYELDPKFIEKISGASGAMARNWRASGDDEEKMYLQAADAWVRAKLRDESGAAIGVDEMRTEYATFFPQYGDTPELIAEKSKQRGILTKQMGTASGVIDSTDTPKTPEANLAPLVVGNIEIVKVEE